MSNFTVELPTLYGDHHVIEVRRLLLELPGVEDVYASSSFQVVEVQYDESKLNPDAIRSRLEEAGYLGEMAMPMETGVAVGEVNGGRPYFRHTTASAETGKTVGFTQQVVAAARPLWPCPGIGVLDGRQKEVSDG